MTQPAAKVEPHYTYADYCHWTDDQRWEIIDGVPYTMSPAPARAHQNMVAKLITQIDGFLEGKSCEVYPAPFDVRLPAQAGEQADTVVQPDISVICDSQKLDDQGCIGAPDWIIEVLSPRTAVKDQIQKRVLYEKHRVREYWLVHPVDRIVTIYRLETDGYGKPIIQETTGTTESLVIEGLRIDWNRILPPLPASEPSPSERGNP